MKKLLTNRGRKIGRAAPVPDWPKSAVRIGFGLIWLVDAAFKWSPDFRTGLLGMVKGAGDGQPSWLHGFFHFWLVTIQPHPYVWAYGVAAIETLIAFALIFGFARKVTYIATIFTALGIWAIAEGFGGPYNATSTDIGAAVMYAVVALALLVLQLQFGPESVQRRLLDRAARELVALGRRVWRSLAPSPRRQGARSTRPAAAHSGRPTSCAAGGSRT